MPKLPHPERTASFGEVALGLSGADAVSEARRCLQCKNAPCVAGCPVEVDIPGFIRHMSAGDFAAAEAAVKAGNALPAICGRVCPQENQCEGRCTLARTGHPISIGALERFVADSSRHAADPGEIERTGKRVAVIGSGPAGLTAAADLARLGHDVTIYEALHAPGGVLRYGIPEFRLPKSILDAEVDYVRSLGVRFQLNAIIGRTHTLDELMERYDAVFISTGAGLPHFMGIPGENLVGVYSANEFLTRVNLMKAFRFPEYRTPVLVGKSVAVVGGGNTAMDSARTARRLGAEAVYLVYRRGHEELPARADEVENAEEEGVVFHLQAVPVALLGNSEGRVVRIRCLRTAPGEPDADGRRRPVNVPDSEHELDVDTVIVATGQSPNPLLTRATPALKTARRGGIIIDPATGATSITGVYAGGDAVSGGATVIAAMGDGRRAARSIHSYLSRIGGDDAHGSDH